MFGGSAIGVDHPVVSVVRCIEEAGLAAVHPNGKGRFLHVCNNVVGAFVFDCQRCDQGIAAIVIIDRMSIPDPVADGLQRIAAPEIIGIAGIGDNELS